MNLITIETECPECEAELTLENFDTDDHDQEIECPECGAVFEEFEYDESSGGLTPMIESMVIDEEPAGEGDDDDDDDEEEEEGEPAA